MYQEELSLELLEIIKINKLSFNSCTFRFTVGVFCLTVDFENDTNTLLKLNFQLKKLKNTPKMPKISKKKP